MSSNHAQHIFIHTYSYILSQTKLFMSYDGILSWLYLPVSNIPKLHNLACLFYQLISHVLCSSVQFSSVAQSCPTLCDPMNRSTPGLPVHHQLLEFTQTQVHRVSDAFQPSHPLSSPYISFLLLTCFWEYAAFINTSINTLHLWLLPL